MKPKTFLSTLCLSLAVTALSLAGPELWMGTWKLNEAKSKFSPGAVKHAKVIYSAEKDEIRIMTEDVDKEGKPLRTVWTGKFDDRDYLVGLDPLVDTRSYKQIDANTLEFIAKKDSQIIATGRVVLSADGKTRTVTTTGTTDGKPFENVAVYDKQ